MKRIALVLLGTVLLSVNTSAWALFGDDEARKAILELRDQLKSQQEVQMSLYDRLEKLTKEVQTLRGKVEDLTNSVGKEKQNAETIYDDLSNRLNEMDPKAKAAAAASDREISAKQELDRCLSVFQKGDGNRLCESLFALLKEQVIFPHDKAARPVGTVVVFLALVNRRAATT